jgi:hypothetical protein
MLILTEAQTAAVTPCVNLQNPKPHETMPKMTLKITGTAMTTTLLIAPLLP